MPKTFLPGSPAFCRSCGNIPHYRPQSADGRYNARRKWLCAYCDTDPQHEVPESDQFTPGETMSNWGGTWTPRRYLGPARTAKNTGAVALLQMEMPPVRFDLFGMNGVATCATPGCDRAVSLAREILCNHQGLDKTCLKCALEKRIEAEKNAGQLSGIGKPRRRTKL